MPIKTGSSPRARGTQSCLAMPRLSWRFIPASAGNTEEPGVARGGIAVHPRERGEHNWPQQQAAHNRGSSPRARGTHEGARALQKARRFIPASAGNTSNALFSSSLRAVHPRERGEHRLTYAITSPSSGSSPRARGTQVLTRFKYCLMRFIPASAGNTIVIKRPWICRAVHPRERGEHDERNQIERWRIGSSPRARGTLLRCGGLLNRRRFIPASAGNTFRVFDAPSSSAVHPRERGEHAEA